MLQSISRFALPPLLLLAALILGVRIVGRLPGLGAISVVLQTANQVGKAVAQAAGQARIGRAHGDAQLAGSFAQANLHAVLIFVRKSQRNIFHAFAVARGGVLRGLEKIGRAAFGNGLAGTGAAGV